MSAKIITLSAKDQDLLRVALHRAVEWEKMTEFYRKEGEPDQCWSPFGRKITADELIVTDRIKDLKARLV